MSQELLSWIIVELLFIKKTFKQKKNIKKHMKSLKQVWQFWKKNGWLTVLMFQAERDSWEPRESTVILAWVSHGLSVQHGQMTAPQAIK